LAKVGLRILNGERFHEHRLAFRAGPNKPIGSKLIGDTVSFALHRVLVSVSPPPPRHNRQRCGFEPPPKDCAIGKI
jgi:hypothetical protein